MKKYYFITGIFILFLSASIGAIAFSTPDYQAKAKEALATSDTFLKQAQDYSCKYLGQAYSDCFAQKKGACERRDTIEADFKTNYGFDAATVCGKEEAAIPPIANDQSSVPPTDPLFFGDEAAGQK